MHSSFSELLDKYTIPVNPNIMMGLAFSQMKYAAEYIDEVLRTANKSFPKGFEYLGYKRATPQEEFEEISRIRSNKRSIDLARADLFLVKYLFSFDGRELPPAYVYLPYVNEGGVFFIGGSQYHMIPVLSDKVISPGSDQVFVRLLRDKIIFRRTYHTVVVDENRVTGHVIWSQLYRKATTTTKTKDTTTTRAYTCVAHYIFAKMGVYDAFLKYAGFVPIIGKDEDITVDKYPVDEWVICRSSKLKPRTNIDQHYVPTNISMAIPRGLWNPISQALVYGFYYVVDHFPNRILLENKGNKTWEALYINNTVLWKILLGVIIFSGVLSENKLYSDINDHFNSLDDYVDSMIINKLKEIGHEVEDFYDLLALILNNFNTFILNTGNTELTMFGKTLEVLYYALFDIIKAIFTLNFKLSKESTKRPLTYDICKSHLVKTLRLGIVFQLVKGKLVAEPTSYSGDHMYFKFTSKLNRQEGGNGNNRGQAKKSKQPDESNHFNMSMAEVGGMLSMPKSDPTPASRLNPFALIDERTNTTVPNQKFNKVRAKTQNMFKGRREDYEYGQ